MSERSSERSEVQLRVDAAMETLRHHRLGYYGSTLRARLLAALPGPVSPIHYRVLRFIEANTPPSPTLSDIAELLLVDRARAARLVDRLAAASMVVRTSDDLDRRVRRVRLTPAGRALLAAAADQRQGLLATIVAGWPIADLHLLASLLERLNHAVAQGVAQGVTVPFAGSPAAVAAPPLEDERVDGLGLSVEAGDGVVGDGH